MNALIMNVLNASESKNIIESRYHFTILSELIISQISRLYHWYISLQTNN